MILSEEIERLRTPNGGWTRATLARWGVPWPPPKGWKHGLLPPGTAEWKPVVGYEGSYEVSSEGIVRSVATGRQIRAHPDRCGYLRLCLSRFGKRSTKKLNRVVAAAFHGDKQNILHREAAHLDGSRTNCRADNLKWVSHRENISHKRFHGTHPSGERHPRAKLSAAQAKLIHQSKGRVSCTVLARRYGVSSSAISDIWCGRRWRGVALRSTKAGTAPDNNS